MQVSDIFFSCFPLKLVNPFLLVGESICRDSELEIHVPCSFRMVPEGIGHEDFGGTLKSLQHF